MIRIPIAAFATLLAASTACAQVPTANEVHAGVRTAPLVLVAPDGARLRAIVTKPRDARGHSPAILFVQWLSCDSIAIPRGEKDGWALMLERLVRESGAIVWRTEKRGIGGSDGDCASLDYETELADHRAALEALRRRRDVDPNRIVIFGASMGSNMAPLLAADQNVAGVLIWGGGARTWAERLLAFERNRVELGETPPAERAAAMNARLRFVDEFLVMRRTPQAIVGVDRTVGAVWTQFAGASDATLYGRPFAFHWQAQQRNWADSWARMRAPILVTYGEFDWFEDASGVELIAHIANRDSPGQARFALISGLDHHFSRYADRSAAFAERGGTADPSAFWDVAAPWLRERFGAR